MVSQELTDFIKKSKAAGQTDEQIEMALIAVGWQNENIEEAFNLINSTKVSYS